MTDEEREQQLLAIIEHNQHVMGCLAAALDENRHTMQTMLNVIALLTAPPTDGDETGRRILN